MWKLTIVGLVGIAAAQYLPSGNPLSKMEAPALPAVTFSSVAAGTIQSASQHSLTQSQAGHQASASYHYSPPKNHLSVPGRQCIESAPSSSSISPARPAAVYGSPHLSDQASNPTSLPLPAANRPSAPSPSTPSFPPPPAPAASYGPPSVQIPNGLYPPNPIPQASYGPPRPQSPQFPIKNYGPPNEKLPLLPPSSPTVIYGPPSRPQRPVVLPPSSSHSPQSVLPESKAQSSISPLPPQSLQTHFPPSAPPEITPLHRPSVPILTYGPPVFESQTSQLPSRPVLSYGPPSRLPLFSTISSSEIFPSLPSASYGPPSATYGPPSQQQSVNFTSETSPQQPSSKPAYHYGPSAPLLPPSKPALSYGPPSRPSPVYGAPLRPSLPTPATIYGPPVSQHPVVPRPPQVKATSPRRPAADYGPP